MEKTPRKSSIIALYFSLLLIPFFRSSACFSGWIAVAPTPSPAPAPEQVSPVTLPDFYASSAKGDMVVGSVPVACESKCDQCSPCVPAEVLIGTTSGLKVDEDDDVDQYYPQVWGCVCQDQIFLP